MLTEKLLATLAILVGVALLVISFPTDAEPLGVKTGLLAIVGGMSLGVAFKVLTWR